MPLSSRCESLLAVRPRLVLCLVRWSGEGTASPHPGSAIPRRGAIGRSLPGRGSELPPDAVSGGEGAEYISQIAAAVFGRRLSATALEKAEDLGTGKKDSG